MNIFRMIVSLFPLIVQIVSAVEVGSGAPPKSGLAKANLVLKTVQAGLEATNAITTQQWTELQPAVEATISNYVEFANAVGVFKTGTPTITVVVPAVLPE